MGCIHFTLHRFKLRLGTGVRGGRGLYHCGHLDVCIWRGEQKTTASFEHLTYQFDIRMRKIIEKDFQTMEYDMLRSNAEFSKFSNISNIQKPHIRQRFLPLQSSKITTQLPPVNE